MSLINTPHTNLPGGSVVIAKTDLDRLLKQQAVEPGQVAINSIDARFILGVLGCLQRSDGIPSSPTFERLRKAILESNPDADVSWTCWQMRSLLEDARTFRRHRAAINKSHT